MKFIHTINYWRNSLADADRSNLDFAKMIASNEVTLEQLRHGKIPSEQIANFFELEEFKKYNTISVILAPLIMYTKKEHGEQKHNHQTMIPFWIPAKVDKSGNLTINNESYPWIPRQYLEPCLQDTVVGSLEDVDNFLSKNIILVETWAEFWEYCEQFFKTVSNSNFSEYNHELFVRSNIAKIGVYNANQGMAKGIRDLYDYILNSTTSNKLLENYATLQKSAVKPLLNHTASHKQATYHLGQMKKFSASKSQRETIHHFFALNDGEILAVNGPPGTGKTTLLQSIIASLWIDSAYCKSNPPIIVVASTNNQAVTNVIDSFASDKSNESSRNIINQRWIPEIQSYGLYLASQSAHKKETWHSLINDFNNPGNFVTTFETKKFIADAEQHFLQKYTTWAGITCNSIAAAVESIHVKLCVLVDEQRTIINSYVEYENSLEEQSESYPQGIDIVIENQVKSQHLIITKLDKFKQLDLKWTQHLLSAPSWYSLLNFFPFKKLIQNKKHLRNKLFTLQHNLSEFSELELTENIQHNKSILQDALLNSEQTLVTLQQDKKRFNHIETQWRELCCKLNIPKDSLFDWLDCDYRFQAFLLATHYWEGCWLLELQNKLNNHDKTTRNRKKQEEKWYRYAKLTPCIVSTLHMLPKFFSAYNGQNIPLDNFIDLLIIDEAGQVSPEIAGASFLLAKKALLIGDTKQIEPVWSIPREIDIHNLIKSKIAINSEHSLEIIETQGISASNGSAMIIAQQRSPFKKFDVGGMYLLEHRRCVPEIISYCNELAYGGYLQLLRDSISNYPLPHLGYAHINGTMYKSSGSLCNETEAEVITDWIANNRDRLLNMYPGSELKDIIAVITPFAKQHQLISRKLKKAQINGLTVGTVHALQGAERPIIIFSSVYDNTQSNYFFDRKINLLNVAVSRAKDSFLVFGNMTIFNTKSNLPSGVLARYLFATEENEIKNIRHDMLAKQLTHPESIRHLHDLDAHCQQLRNCILSGANEVCIVSPFLSYAAIEADQLIEAFQRAINHGTKITVYTDSQLNSQSEAQKASFIKAQQQLKQVGVSLRIANRIHNKTIWVDKKILIEGSFNWLSGRRDINSKWCRYETSLVYQGEHVDKMIDKIALELQKRVQY